MQNTTILHAIILAGATVAAGLAQAAEIKASGTATYANTSAEETKLPDGSTLLRFHQKGVLVDKDPTSPFNLNAQDCDGMVIIASDGKSAQGSGGCDAVDKDGDRWWIWWADGPNGAPWGVTYGTGKFAGMTGGGTTKTIIQLPDRSAIIYEGTVNMK